MNDTLEPRQTADSHPKPDTLTHIGASRVGTPRVLCVDDDLRLLDGLRRVLGSEFEIVTASDPVVALGLLETNADFEVVLCDLRMPRMNGTQFLVHSKRIIPAATRLLLTGVPDLGSAIASINEGGVFRFLTKPCPSDQLLDAVHAAVNQHRMSFGAESESNSYRRPGSISRIQRPLPHPAFVRDGPEASGRFPAMDAARARSAAAAPPNVRQSRPAWPRSGSHLAVLAGVVETALAEGRALDAERVVEGPLRALLKDAQAGMPMDPTDAEKAVVLAARLAAATNNGTWLDYAFSLFCALRRLLPSDAIDEVQTALHHVRGANVGPLELYLSILELQGRALNSTERCLLRRIQQCRALMPVAV